MLIFRKDSVNIIRTSLAELSTLASPTYLIEMISDQSLISTTCIAADTSAYPSRYNEFTITETATPNNLNAEILLEPVGYFTYNIYEQISTTNLSPSDAGVILLESGKSRCLIDGDRESTTYTFELANQYGDTLSFGYDHKAKQFFINRSKSGKVDFSPEFTKGPSTAPRFSNDDMISLEFVLDKMSIELFYDSGEAVMTEIFFPNAPYQTLTLRTDDPTNTKYSATILEVNPSKNKE